MVSSISSSGGSPALLAPASAADDAQPTPANDAASASESPAVQVTLSAEAELTMTTTETLQITATNGSANGSSAANDAGQPQAPQSARALSTLKSIAQSERAWIAAMKASYEGKKTPKSDATASASTDAKSTSNAPGSGAQGSEAEGAGVEITIQQQTSIQMSLSASVQVDGQA
jgi:hypothetical protein